MKGLKPSLEELLEGMTEEKKVVIREALKDTLKEFAAEPFEKTQEKVDFVSIVLSLAWGALIGYLLTIFVYGLIK